jgi:cytoskeletal protein CcmA (bactofilin family)
VSYYNELTLDNMTLAETQETPLLGRLTSIQGRISAGEDLLLLGAFNGFVEAPGRKITIGPEAQITGNVTAREVVVYGAVHGDIVAAERLEIRQPAKVRGDVRSSGILIEAGACFHGSVDIGAPRSVVSRKFE